MLQIRIQPPAIDDIRRHFRYLERHEVTADYAYRWYDEIRAAIRSLTDFPLSHPLAPENEHFDEEIRHRLVGWYRILFTVVDDRVHVLHIRHGRQDILALED